ncbi:Lactoylglutathione lyase [Beijerinckiaceae bacterium RH AL1]|jgi:lactoylglutathione lyase|nr:VOC family protein [Beijerinckiaceae bacterium]VVB45811.1 Lactoylglutathione lyase [Beijerinckiaceae bacterium RH CH11]VVB45888.1 Lactoylglutathione lyase [Beijerinckiaceae bacterium RH AL8]VVC55053.1 Lactoylglutathione lyase [Beijerinckiaceae bacterium RH AL1]
MRYLHTMVRVENIERALDFWVNKLGLEEVRRTENEKGRFTLVFLAAPDDSGRSKAERAPEVELTYNWDPETYDGGRNFGHLAYEVDDIYALCDKLQKSGVTINRPPRDGKMAFVRSPENISIELLQKGSAKEPAEPWKSMENTGVW